MVIMFHLNQAALLSIQLLLMHQLVAGNGPFFRRSKQVSIGKSVTLTCNASMANATQINWSKGNSSFVHWILKNLTASNLTSPRLRVDPNLPLKLHIINVQQKDTGLYICTTTSINILTTTEWNLTVSEEREAVGPSWYFLYILTGVLGFLLCCIISAVCVCRKLGARKSHLNPDQFRHDLEGEVVLAQPQAVIERRTYNKRRSQYIERLNSIYD